MPLCPRCEHPVKATDLACGHCRLPLKAHGHPSIELHQATAGEVLCLTCAYHADDSCTFPQRPAAQTCTLYQAVGATATLAGDPSGRSPRSSTPRAIHLLWQRHKVWLILLAIFGVSLLLTVF
ncbi:MAG TPA: hypothetical protein V6D02_07310 [Candidatus Obscuribacterales bacterium]